MTETTINKGSCLRFTKMTGTGNDFLILDSRAGTTFPQAERALVARTLCRRSLSIGADGVVFLQEKRAASSSLGWDFYNADGSSAEFCGNAARCVARYAFEMGISGANVIIETTAGPVKARVFANGSVEVEMPKPTVIGRRVEVPVGEHLKSYVVHVNTGVPHAVLESNDWDEEYLFEMGDFLRHHELFKKTGGVNATFFEATGENSIQSATFERGVESVTLACGTGAVAAAVAASFRGVKSPVEVQVPGGLLTVELGVDLAYAKLSGEARFICEGEIKPEALL